MFRWIESYGLNRKPWACACTSHFLLLLCFCFIVVAFVFYNCVLCFLFFIVSFVHWWLCSPPTIRLLLLLNFPFSTLLLHSFCWTFTLHWIAHLHSLISYCFVILLLFKLSFFSALGTMLAPWLFDWFLALLLLI